MEHQRLRGSGAESSLSARHLPFTVLTFQLGCNAGRRLTCLLSAYDNCVKCAVDVGQFVRPSSSRR